MRDSTQFMASLQHDPNTLSNNTIDDIRVDQSGQIWVATAKGLNKLVPSESGKGDQTNAPDFLHYLADDLVISVFIEHLNGLWVGTKDHGLYRFDPQREEFIQYSNEPSNPNSLSHNDVYSLFEDKSGGLWIGTQYGLDIFDRETEAFRHYTSDPENRNSLSHYAINTIYEDHSGVVEMDFRVMSSIREHAIKAAPVKCFSAARMD